MGPSVLLTVYSTPWCGHCTRLKRQMESAGLAYVDIDIEADPDAERLVRTVNGGSATVPVVALPGGQALPNPSLAEVLEALGTAA